MRRLLQVAIPMVLVGAAILLAMRLWPGPEQQIRKRMVELQELVSFDESEGNFAALTAREQLGAMFSPDAEVRVQGMGTPQLVLTGRLAIMNAAVAARRQLAQLEVEFLDVTVELAADGQSATVEATGKARQEAIGDGTWIEVLRFKFIRTEEGWLISSVEPVTLFTLRSRSGVQVSRGLAHT